MGGPCRAVVPRWPKSIAEEKPPVAALQAEAQLHRGGGAWPRQCIARPA